MLNKNKIKKKKHMTKEEAIKHLSGRSKEKLKLNRKQ